jgi:TolA-binding protein
MVQHSAARIPLRLGHPAMFVTLAACAGGQMRLSPEAEEIKELRAQLQAQSALVAQQQQRIEGLEVKLAALVARSLPHAPQPKAQAPAPAPAKPEPRPSLRTVKIGEGRRLRRTDHINPVDRAPRLEATVQLREPDEDALARLETDTVLARAFDADRAWAEAVRKLNDGMHDAAEIELLAFVAAHPHHTAADNALYLAGLVREVRGDCVGALQLFESVPVKYPAGDAVPQALLERGRCLRLLGRGAEAKKIFFQLDREHPDAQEAAAGRQLLQGL